ncbi:MAG: hypothetical protein IIT37_02490 [Bacteroidales bacterium]|nr:hypothetical protein [Bacteroidales bacterium]
MNSKIYVIITSAAFAVMFVVLNFFPRSTFSERERRDLAHFPDVATAKLTDGSFTRDISHWYSDSEPFRDGFLSVSELFDHYKGITISTESGEQIAIVSGGGSIEDPGLLAGTDDDEDDDDSPDSGTGEPVDIIVNADTTAPKQSAPKTDTTGAAYSKTSSGVMLVGKEPNVRAMLLFGCSAAYVKKFTDAVNLYHETFPDVNIWVMPIPIAIAFYCPEEAKKLDWPQKPCLDAVQKNLAEGVHFVDIYPTLMEHKDEAIYLRTDHHWSPLGGFYASEVFAKDAGLTFPSIEEGYTTKVVHGFVGTMYGYSKSLSVKRSPEDFIYYYPNTNFTTYVTGYELDEDFKITKMHAECKRAYFAKFKDGSSGAYCTFMGSDKQITRVVTSANNGRRIIILKDSFGNTIPSCLFYAFEEVHVIDYRYFTLNMKKYVADHKITDILFANNLTFCVTGHAGKSYKRFLTQGGGGGTSDTPAKDTVKKDTPAKDTAQVVTPAKDTVKEDIIVKDTVQ